MISNYNLAPMNNKYEALVNMSLQKTSYNFLSFSGALWYTETCMQKMQRESAIPIRGRQFPAAANS